MKKRGRGSETVFKTHRENVEEKDKFFNRDEFPFENF